ncbi:predicted protein [Sclerotinia sclerotiorum 1980 UF-70]|uniref:Uncharacterized protein n=1 Tax=Sclerotinia sclerotiorum (strain ATCC 18683 / 1980 / Ss-1) TaxID=665079 RepID=A7ESV0_SCLS1|nr:predicted protein [Sclerotinia sclerotiorum 1980 UF-70]EDN92542.1 predicted protein [Sclerotinia sclerotiorum 1980 UF-70]
MSIQHLFWIIRDPGIGKPSPITSRTLQPSCSNSANFQPAVAAAGAAKTHTIIEFQLIIAAHGCSLPAHHTEALHLVLADDPASKLFIFFSAQRPENPIEHPQVSEYHVLLLDARGIFLIKTYEQQRPASPPIDCGEL